MTTFHLFRRNLPALVLTFDADSMDHAIDHVCPSIVSGSCDIDCISDDCTMFADESGDVVTEYALVEARDYCTTCTRDYDAMSADERAAHECDGEMVVTTCAGTTNGVVWS